MGVKSTGKIKSSKIKRVEHAEEEALQFYSR
jgi:hypothetical protein